MTSSGSAYARFRRALTTGNLDLIRAAAAELPQVALDDALEVCQLMATREPERYERAALRWIVRLLLERRDMTLQKVADAAAALDALRTDPVRARDELRRVVRR